METVGNFLLKMITVPPDQMVGVIALAGICVAGFALYVVHSVVKGRDK